VTIFAKKKPSGVERSTEEVLNLEEQKNSYENQSCSTDEDGSSRSIGCRFEWRDHGYRQFRSKRLGSRLQMRSGGSSVPWMR
jgi:hypothetical protein